MIVPDAFPVLCQPTFLRSQRNKCFTASPCENTQFHFNFHTSWLSIFQLCSQSSELYLFVPWQTFFPLSYICIFHSIYITMPSVLDINYPTHTHIFLSVSNLWLPLVWVYTSTSSFPAKKSLWFCFIQHTQNWTRRK